MTLDISNYNENIQIFLKIAERDTLTCIRNGHLYPSPSNIDSNDPCVPGSPLGSESRTRICPPPPGIGPYRVLGNYGQEVPFFWHLFWLLNYVLCLSLFYEIIVIVF